MSRHSHAGPYYIFLAAIYAGIFQYGGIGKYNIAFISAITGGLILWLCTFRENASISWENKRLRMSAVAYSICIMIGVIQCIPGISFGASSALYAAASRALGTSVWSFISLSPQDTLCGLLRLITYGGAFWLGLNAGVQRRRAIRLLTVMAFSGGVYSLASLYQYNLMVQAAAEANTFFTPSTYILTMIRNHFADFIGIHLIIALALVWHVIEHSMEKNEHNGQLVDIVNTLLWRLMPLLVLISLFSVSLILTASRAGVLSSFIGILILCIVLNISSLKIPQARSLIFSSSIIILFCGLLALCGIEIFHRYGQMQEEISRRLQLNIDTASIVASFPLLGSGIDSFIHAYKAYSSEALLYLYSGNVEVEHAHNGYLEVMATMGIAGFLCVMIAMGGIISHCLYGVYIRKRRKAIPTAGIAIAALMGCHSLFDFGMQIPTIALLVMFILGISFARALPERASV